MKSFDVAIVGGGMVGAAAAIGFAQQGKKVVVIEGVAPASFHHEQMMDIRVSAISQSSVTLLDSLGAWQHIEAMRVCPYRRLETWEHPECRTRFNAESIGLDLLGYIVENRLIQLGLWSEFSSYENLTLMCPETLVSTALEDDSVTMELKSGEQIKAQWVIGADGANSRVREMTGIGITAWDYRQHCMLINVETELAQQDITWQQFTPAGPRSFLPLCGSRGSLVWYDTPSRIRQLSGYSVDKLRDEILMTFPKELGDIRVIESGSFPLTRRHAHSYVSNRSILIGDAAHTINPLAGQGVNLGFKDVSALLESMSGHAKITKELALNYERRRKPDNLLMQTGMDLFYKGFSNSCTPLKLARNAALKLADHSGSIKAQALKYALGL